MAVFTLLALAVVLAAALLDYILSKRRSRDDSPPKRRAASATPVRGQPPRNPGPFLNSYRPKPDPRPPAGVPSPLLPPRPTLSAGNAKTMEETELHVV